MIESSAMGLSSTTLGVHLYQTIINHSSLNSGPPVISVIGSGGKTSLIELLARECVRDNRKVLITTTTKMASPRIHQYYGVDTFSLDTDTVTTQGSCTLWGYTRNNKLTPVSPKILEQAVMLFDMVLIEADGANRMPLKLHRPDEPVIHPATTATVQVFGASAIGKPPLEVIHRFEESEDSSDTVTIGMFLKCMNEVVSRKGYSVQLINQADAIEEQALESLMQACESLERNALIYGSVHSNSMYHKNGGVL